MKRINVEHIDYELAAPNPESDLERRFFVQIDQEKCNGCGECKHHCPMDAIYGEMGLAHRIIHPEPCLHCGMCLTHCPEGAIYETASWLEEVERRLRDPESICIAMPAPSLRYTIGEAFGLGQGVSVAGALRAAFRKIGFAHCWDMEFGADITIWEEGSEFIQRLDSGGPFPQLSSCCSSWQKYAETFQPDILPYFSSCKSPMGINGRLAKTYGADRFGYDAGKVYTVAIVPCIAKKYEALRPELGAMGRPDIDAVLTTRELAWLLRKLRINLLDLSEGSPDTLMGIASGGTMFGIGGGVLELLCRFTYHKITGNPPPKKLLVKKGEVDGMREYELKIGKLDLSVAAIHGAEYFAQACESIRNGTCPHHFIEFMACPGGCMNGGGQILMPSLLKKMRKKNLPVYAEGPGA